jgi:hypothetical protein
MEKNRVVVSLVVSFEKASKSVVKVLFFSKCSFSLSGRIQKARMELKYQKNKKFQF